MYLHQLDIFIKHHLRVRYYMRYCDDFIILSANKHYLENIISQINNFLMNNLKVLLHPHKIILKPYHQGIDFLGYISFPYHVMVRTKTKKRMFAKIKKKIMLLKNGILSQKSFYQMVVARYLPMPVRRRE